HSAPWWSDISAWFSRWSGGTRARPRSPRIWFSSPSFAPSPRRDACFPACACPRRAPSGPGCWGARARWARGEALALPAGEGPGVTERLEKEQRRRLVRAALDALTRRQREV